MNFTLANQLKESIASTFLQSKNERRIVYAAALAPRASAVRNKLLTDVKAVGIGERMNGENYIKVLIKKRSVLKPADISQYYGSQAKNILVQETGPIRFKFSTNKHRPPFPGISVGHYKVTAGTLGCFVKDSNNKIYILSNNHVLANCNKAKTLDEILQPGKLDGGLRRKDVIAKLSHFIPLDFNKPNYMDAAIAEVEDDLRPIYKIAGKQKITGTLVPNTHMKVSKFGRTTEHKNGRITVKNLDMKVDFDGKDVEFYDQFEVQGYNGSMFCDGGDSGSIVYERGSLKAVGLLFAGTDDGTTFATPIKNVLKEFSVKIL
jgi:hypothetical protein